MGVLFISHSSVDNEAALRVRDWLKEHGWGQVFLDLDPSLGLAPGQRWQQELKHAGERCSGVVILVSPHWLASRWCQTEFLVADQLGKKIFPIFVAPTPFDDLPIELKGKFQFADVSTQEKQGEGFERLALGLKRAGLDPRSFEWPPPGEPHRAIYRGLQSLDEQDAAIFFGREALITKGMDALRRMRDGAPERLLAILGASGAGKSSFLKAGLISRLRRDEENFLVLPVIRPARAALTGVRGLAASLGCDAKKLNTPEDLANCFARFRAPVAERMRRFAEGAHIGDVARLPTIVIALDQAEELFAAENEEAAHVLDLLASTMRADPDILIIATIRSDAFSKLQGQPRLADIPVQPFSLASIPLGAFKEVIEGPARLANPPLTVESELSDRLLKDLAAEDALPLLAFTLERLSARHPHGGTITLAEYVEEMGGLQGAIVGAVEMAFANARRDPALPHSLDELEKLARAAFIPALVNLDDADAEPRRRVERLSALPEATHPLVRHLIDQRLLVSNRTMSDGIEIDTIEVTHEAILRQWPALRGWIAEERDALRALDATRDAALEWKTHADPSDAKQGQSWLAHRGGRLQEAEALLARPGFASALGATALDYLAACRAHENTELLREQLAIKRTRRLQRNIGVLIAIAAVVVLLAGSGIFQLLSGMAVRASDSLAAQAAKESEAGNYDRGARYALAGLTGADAHFMGHYGARAEAELKGAIISSSALAILHGHTEQVWTANFSPDGKRIVTASADKTARIWDAITARAIAVLRGHEDQVTGAAFSPDGKRIITASNDHTVRIWDASTGRQIAVLRGHHETVTSAAFSPDGKRILTASRDKTVRIWDAGTGRETMIIRNEDQIECAGFSPDGTRIVTASADKTARIWDASTGHEIAALRGHQDAVTSAAFSPDGKRIVTASADKTARVWDVSTGQQTATLREDQGAITGAAFSRDGQWVVTGSDDAILRIWDVNSAREIRVMHGHDQSINTAMFSPDGTRIVTASDDGTARIWDAVKAHGIVVLRGHEGSVFGAAFSPDAKHIVTASTDNTARIWDSITGREIVVLRGHEDSLETAAFSPDGKRIVTAAYDRTARIWDAGTAHQIAVLRGHQETVTSAVFSPDGKRIVTASRDRTARVWDANTARETAVLRGHREGVTSAAFSPDGRRIVTASRDRTARIWDANTAREIAVLRGHTDLISNAAFSPDGKRIVTASNDHTARIWDANSAQEIAVLRAHEGGFTVAAFSPDGKRVVTASRDKAVRIWDVDTAQEIAVLHGHDDQINSAAFSPDGQRILTASDDRTARIWNISRSQAASASELVHDTCETSLSRGLNEFSDKELRAVPVLDSRLDSNACHPPGFWASLGRIFSASLSR